EGNQERIARNTKPAPPLSKAAASACSLASSRPPSQGKIATPEIRRAKNSGPRERACRVRTPEGKRGDSSPDELTSRKPGLRVTAAPNIVSRNRAVSSGSELRR